MDELSRDLASLKISREDTNRPQPLRRWLVGAVVLAGVGLAGYVGVAKLGAQIFKHSVETTRVSMVSPVQASVQVTSTGYVIPQVASLVAAKISGRLSEVRVKEGDTVKKGDVIATLADADQRSAIAAAQSQTLVMQAQVETARANLAEGQSKLDRTRRLVTSNAVPRAQLEDLEARMKVLTEMVSAAEAESRATRAQANTLHVGLKDRVIVAPIDGTIVTKPASVGEMVGPETPILMIADFTSLMVETDVPEARLHRVSPGTNCEIVLDAYPSRHYRGVAGEIGKRINRAKATVMVKVKFVDDIEGVLPEMAARVSFLEGEISKESLEEKPKKVVSRDAVAHRDGSTVLYVVEDGAARMTRVQVGQPLGDAVELQDGPPDGTLVILRPGEDIFDGQKIKEKEK